MQTLKRLVATMVSQPTYCGTLSRQNEHDAVASFRNK